eukprot:scaffold5422_cov36-Tisochrysis_lutea.AAC.2
MATRFDDAIRYARQHAAHQPLACARHAGEQALGRGDRGVAPVHTLKRKRRESSGMIPLTTCACDAGRPSSDLERHSSSVRGSQR